MIVLVAFSIVCTVSFTENSSRKIRFYYCEQMGSVLGAVVHFMVAQNLEKNASAKASKRDVALITLYLQIPQHVFEIICIVFLVYGLIQVRVYFLK